MKVKIAVVASAGTWIESTGPVNAEVLARFAPGIARETDRAGELRAVVGMSPATVTGALEIHRPGAEAEILALSAAANERIEFDASGRINGRSMRPFVPPTAGC